MLGSVIGAIDKRVSKVRESDMKAEWPLHNCFLQRKHLSTMAVTLVPLPEIERLSSQVIRILGGNPGKVS